MKSVLLSIQPKWCELIASEKKTIEVRKTRPKIETPFKCYIYCTKSNKEFLQSRNNILFYCENRDFIGGHGVGLYKRLNGKVIGEFVCRKIDTYPYNKNGYGIAQEHLLCTLSCLEEKELYHYLQGSKPYAWNISDIVIYDKPKELSEFFHYCGDNPKCDGCEAHYYSSSECGTEDYCCSVIEGCKPLTRPPQSWCYVEEVE